MFSQISFLVLLLTSTAGFYAFPEGADREEQLWHYRNLGKAFYENPTTQYEAVEQFEKALELNPDSARERLNYGLSLLRAGQPDEGVKELEAVQQTNPEIPHTWFNLGIVYKKRADYAAAVRQFEKMVELVPDEPISRYNLGVLYRLTGEPEKSLTEFELTAALDPNLAGPHFQLYNAYRAAGRTEDAAAALKTFNELKKRNAGSAIAEDLEWSYYSEIYDTIEPREFPDAVPAEELAFKEVSMPGRLKGTPLGLAALELQGEGSVDLMAWSEDELRLFPGRTGDSRVVEGLSGIVSASAVDFNNDGLFDACVITSSGPVLLVNRQGTFERVDIDFPSGNFRKALWHDFDHDSDSDLFLFGDRSVLLRNNGDAGFADHSESFPFVDGEVLDAVSLDLVKDTNGTDLVTTFRDRTGVLYKDRLGGQYQVTNLVQLPPLTSRLLAADLDNDGWTDLLAAGPRPTLAFLNRNGSLEPNSLELAPGGPVTIADLENRGLADIVVGYSAHANLGLGRFGPPRPVARLTPAIDITAGDFNGDGLVDLAILTSEGDVARLDNQIKTDSHWIKITLEGVRNPVLAPGAEVEVKAGVLYQKRLYEGLPLIVGLGSYEKVDAVRITWPNGLIQNELQQEADRHVTYKEAQRLSGSCPMIFTWNGTEFQFITDVLGVAPLGASAGDGEYFPVDHDEYIQIPGPAMAEKDGFYEVRITEELREVSYLDQIRLIAVDHPASTSVFTSDKFKGPPFPSFRLYGVDERHYPLGALDSRGEDVLDRVLQTDRRYPDNFERDYNGVAELHSLELEFEPSTAADNRSILVLHGWVDWADGSTFLRAMQSGSELVLPYLQVLDGDGNWQTVVEDMGLPAGKPKTIVVDLTGKFLSEQRKIRIVTNLCVYWDEVFLGENTAEPSAHLVDVELAQADLRFRGFSRPVIHPQRRQPEVFVYSDWMPISMWNQTPGNYTRYGDVAGLIADVDDRMVIMGSGDELRLLYPADQLPPVREGWTRNFLLRVDGWAKDGDLNTAFSTSVEPLPFHGMSRYPYPPEERYPDGEEHRRYLEKYNVRPALRLISPLGNERAGQRQTPAKDFTPSAMDD